MGKELVYLLFLAVHTVTDIREKQIYVAVLVLQAFAGMAFQIYSGQAEFRSILSCLPGLMCLGIAGLSKEAVGYGDGWMILLGGLYFSLGQVLEQLLWASLAACPYVAWQLTTRKISVKEEIPFAPFFLIGYLGGILYG